MAAKLPDSGDDAGDENDGLFAEINITPLTDVFLVMVVIFMVSALAEVEQTRKEQKQTQQDQQQSEAEKRSGLRVNVPKGKAQEIDTSKASLVLTIPMQGDVEIGGKAMHDADIDGVFQAAFQRDHNTQVILKADKKRRRGSCRESHGAREGRRAHASGDRHERLLSAVSAASAAAASTRLVNPSVSGDSASVPRVSSTQSNTSQPAAR